MKTARKKANEKWDNKNIESLTVRLKIGLKEQYHGYAKQLGIPFAEYFRQAMEEKAEREGLK